LAPGVINFPHANENQGAIQQFAFPWVHGCCFVAERAIFDQIGDFDTQFFAYYEDADYWKRAQQLGIEPRRAEIVIKHAMNATSGKLPELGQMIQESQQKFVKKWG
jgi:GT2 family glycosyltransferase